MLKQGLVGGEQMQPFNLGCGQSQVHGRQADSYNPNETTFPC